MELTPFYQIDIDYPETGIWTEHQLEAAEFLFKMDSEGGPVGLLGYSGTRHFPEELKELAQTADDALLALGQAIDQWAAARGVSY